MQSCRWFKVQFRRRDLIRISYLPNSGRVTPRPKCRIFAVRSLRWPNDVSLKAADEIRSRTFVHGLSNNTLSSKHLCLVPCVCQANWYSVGLSFQLRTIWLCNFAIWANCPFLPFRVTLTDKHMQLFFTIIVLTDAIILL
jgi:hypothetical protein